MLEIELIFTRINDRFWSKVEVGEPNDCWLWEGSTFSTGYGRFRNKTTHTYAHRIAYLAAKRYIPEGLHIDHLCRVRTCCNPAHLEAVTNGENVKRGFAFRDDGVSLLGDSTIKGFKALLCRPEVIYG